MTVDEIKALVNRSDYYNRYSRDKHWYRLVTIAGRAMQSAEANELQEMFDEKIRSIGKAVYADGTIINGCGISFDTTLKTVTLEAGDIALDGLVWNIEAATLTAPDEDNVQVGIWLKSKCVTEYNDTSLLDPAVGTKMKGMKGAQRIVTTPEWGFSTDRIENMPFYPLYGISGGEIVTQVETTPPAYMEALSQYDRHAHGHYVYDGLRVTALASPGEMLNTDRGDEDTVEYSKGSEVVDTTSSDSSGGKQVFSISEGEAHIDGYEAVLSHSVRLIVDELPDLGTIQSEVHVYMSTDNRCTVAVDHTPIESISQIRVTKERTVTLTHDTYTGCTDELPDTSVYEVISVNQGALYFTENDDFYLASNRLSWSPSGEEPAPGSKYTVVYRYRINTDPDAWTTTDFTVSGLVENSLVEVDYTFRMPRWDLIVMYRDCSVGIVRGVPHRYAPVVPSTPPEAICLAQVYQDWDGLPKVTNNAIQAVPMSTINSMQSQIMDLYSLAAQNEMRFDAMISAPSSAFGVFVDPLFDDDMRDAGTEQTALIASQTLQLPVTLEAVELPLEKEAVLNFEHEVLIDQPVHTQSMKVNPYMAFDPLPVEVSLTPSVDHYTKSVQQTFNSALVDTHWWEKVSESRYTYRNLISTTRTVTTQDLGVLRQIQVKVKAAGFGPNEGVTIYFDSVKVSSSSRQADASGKYEGTFTIPAGIPVGTKLVRLQGAVTSVGYAYFTGSNKIVTTTIRRLYRYKDDPLAQTFTLLESRHVSGVDFWLTKKGTSAIRVDIRAVSNGMPTTEALATCLLEPSALKQGAWNRAVFDAPVFLSSDATYAVTILTDTADHEVGVTALGDWDSSRGWVRSQVYQAGVLLSSSNSETWTPHQTMDMTFRLLGAKFTGASRTVSLGTLNLTGVTDIMPLAEVESTGADTDATFVLSQNGTEIARMQAWQAAMFTEPLNGSYDVSVELFGDETHSPVLGRDSQLITGKIGTRGVYVSRAFICGSGKRIMVSTVENVPTGSSVRVSVETEDGIFTAGEVFTSEQLGDGWVRQTRFVNCDLASTRIKIELEGTTAARPMVQEISAVVLSV